MRDQETGWLVEMVTPTAVFWWSIPLDDEPQWTQDSIAALRFSRKADALAYIQEAGWTEVSAVEHQWGPDPKPAVGG